MLLNKERKKFLLVLPVIAWPFLCFTFSRLGGGNGATVPIKTEKGINPELPSVKPDAKQVFLDKLKLYDKAEQDSLRKRQYQRQDPYRRDTLAGRRLASSRMSSLGTTQPAGDLRAEQLLARLRQLKQGLQQPAKPPIGGGFERRRDEDASVIRGHDGHDAHDDTAGESRMGRLNDMLDKVIRIQHPEEGHRVVENRQVDEILPAEAGANTIAATIPSNQTLTSGTTISLRITDSIKVNGRVSAGGQLIYGVVTMANDRMLVHITGLRQGDRLYSTDLQVYDLDGIPGIHIPAELSRDVAKQSADQGVNSLNVLNVDPSLGAQAATAGIQTVKAFVGRKVRQVRVTVRAGYQVLLRNGRAQTSLGLEVSNAAPDAGVLRPPGFDPGGPILSHCRTEGLELALRDVSLDQGLLWFGLQLANHAAIGYAPAYARWYIRDRRKLRRTAMQELPVEPVYTPGLATVAGDSSVHSWTGFKPFAIEKDKELILEIGEKGGGRVLLLTIDHRILLHAKKQSP